MAQSHKRLKTSSIQINIESLPNELLADCFKYLSTNDLVQAFHGLNYRFDLVLLHHFRLQGFNFQSISRLNFDIICQTYLPQTVDQITSICLSEDDHNPGQIEQFLNHGFKLRQFIHLKSLSICHLRSNILACKIILELEHLPNLTHLTYTPIFLSMNEMQSRMLISNIWRLSKLTHCYLSFHSEYQTYFPVPLIVSTSLKYLTIQNIELFSHEVSQLLKQTPNLEHLTFDLNIQIPFNFGIDLSPNPRLLNVLQITKLNIKYFYDSNSHLLNVLLLMPNLCQLKLNKKHKMIDGFQWEQIISEFFPRLKSFKFNMSYKLPHDANKKQKIDTQLDTFRSEFWLNKHKWFVQCDWNPDEDEVYFYTLSYAFENFYFIFPRFSKTTYPYENNQWSYNHVRALLYQPSMSKPSDLSNFQFLNISTLFIKLPINDDFWSLVLHFGQVRSLVLSWNENYEYCRNQLQILLNRMPSSLVLYIEEKSSSVLEVLSFETKETPRYDISFSNTHSSFNNEQCMRLCSLPAINQCTELKMAVEDRTCVVDIVNKLNNLQALTVLCKDDKWNINSISDDDEFVEWLRQHLPSSCKIRRNPLHQIVGIWIR